MAKKAKRVAAKKTRKVVGKKAVGHKLIPPVGGAIVRMYRIGHGDCFLLAFNGVSKPIYVLIDCGYKPGSPDYINTKPDDVVADIRAVTGAHIDVAVITHEHQDHVNAITKKRFEGFTIGEVWFAWTESADDKLARRLRKKYSDRLRALVAASNRLAAADPDLAARINELIALEIGGEEKTSLTSIAALAVGGTWTNKDSMKLLRDLSAVEARSIYPHKEIIQLPGSNTVRVFALGPPYDEDQLKDLDPHDGEGFPQHRIAGKSSIASFAAAVTGPTGYADSPFSARHCIRLDEINFDSILAKWYAKYYGSGEAETSDQAADQDEVPSAAKFRRIDHDWLQSAENIALAMGNDTNNASLVLAFEVGKGGKVLLFAADAQRGNWASWAAKSFDDGNNKVHVRDLLGRTVFYKAGHHGSHNATLSGIASSEHPNLSWLGRGKYAGEFTAMITAVRKWAIGAAGWDHPLKSIKEALLDKCAGRVFQTDTDFERMKKPEHAGERPWKSFQSHASGSNLYFDYRIEP